MDTKTFRHHPVREDWARFGAMSPLPSLYKLFFLPSSQTGNRCHSHHIIISQTFCSVNMLKFTKVFSNLQKQWIEMTKKDTTWIKSFKKWLTSIEKKHWTGLHSFFILAHLLQIPRKMWEHHHDQIEILLMIHQVGLELEKVWKKQKLTRPTASMICMLEKQVGWLKHPWSWMTFVQFLFQKL